jgi:hypothetical protein
MERSGAKPGRLPESALAIQIDTTLFRLGIRASHGFQRFIHSFNRTVVKSNDFHETMEIILDHASSAKNAEALIRVGERYGAWLAIKLEDHALAGDLAPIRKEFDPAFSEGRKAVSNYLDALRGGNIDAANKLSRGVKNAYKKMWALDPK